MKMSIWVSSNCNMRCAYCYEESFNGKNKGIFSFKEDELLDYIKIYKPNIVIFHGGEPLLNYKLIFSITHEIKDIVSNFGFTTNGTIWNTEIEEFLHQNKHLFENWTSVSIDGDQHTYELNRKFNSKVDTYENVCKTAHNMLKILPGLRVRMTITPNNCSFLYSNILYLINMGFRQISTAYNLYDKQWTNNEIEILSVEYDKIYDFWKQKKNIEIGIIDELRFKKELGSCEPGTNIYINGDIYPCNFVVGNEKFKIGNIKSGIDAARFEYIKVISRPINEFCLDCTNNKSCLHNRCKLLNYCINNDFNKPSAIGCALENLKVIKFKKWFMNPVD